MAPWGQFIMSLYLKSQTTENDGPFENSGPDDKAGLLLLGRSEYDTRPDDRLMPANCRPVQTACGDFYGHHPAVRMRHSHLMWRSPQRNGQLDCQIIRNDFTVSPLPLNYVYLHNTVLPPYFLAGFHAITEWWTNGNLIRSVNKTPTCATQRDSCLPYILVQSINSFWMSVSWHHCVLEKQRDITPKSTA